jgi:hypothetical protein
MKLNQSKLNKLIKEMLNEQGQSDWNVREHTEFSRVVSEIKNKLRRVKELLEGDNVRMEELPASVFENIESILEHESLHKFESLLMDKGYEAEPGFHMSDADYELPEEDEEVEVDAELEYEPDEGETLEEVYSKKQRRWACAQINKPASKKPKGLSKKEAKEMCKSKKIKKKKRR